MSTNVTYNGTAYVIPDNREPKGWGASLSAFLIDVGGSALSKSGGTFVLTANVDFGANFGLLSTHYSTRHATPATAGQFRLGNDEVVSWRDAGNTADLNLKANTSDQLEFNGNVITSLALGAAYTALRANAGGTATEYSLLDNNSIAAAAAIAVDKLAASTVSRALVSDASGFITAATTTAAEIEHVNGVTSAIQTQLNTKLENIVEDTTPVLGGDLDVSTFDIVSAANADIDILPNGSGEINLDTTAHVSGTGLYVGATQDASAAIDITSTTQGFGLPNMTATQRDAISSPKTGLKIWNTTAGAENIYDGSSWAAAGGGGSGSGEINYISNPDAETNADDWNTYDDGASATPVDGTGGSPSTLTFTAQSSHVIRGGQSFKLAKSAANGQGEGISTDFTIDKADPNKLLKISFQYNTDLTYTDEDIKVYIYDVTSATLITPADNGIIGVDKVDASSGSRTIGWASTDSVSYRLIFHQTTTNASTADFYFDNVIVGPGSVATGAVVTAWESYTPSNTQGFGTITSRLQWRRVGENVEIQGDFTAGTTATSEAQIELPNSYAINFASATGTVIVGTYSRNAAEDITGLQLLGTDGDTFINFARHSITTNYNPLTAVNGDDTVGSAQRVSFNASVPVAEFQGSGTVNLMSDNVAAANVKVKYNITDTSYTANSTVDFDTEVTDYFTTVGTWANTNGAITIPADGTYDISCYVRANSAGSWDASTIMSVHIDSTVRATLARVPISITSYELGGTTSLKLSKGAILTIECNENETLDAEPSATQLTITRQQDYSAGQPVAFGDATATTAGLTYKVSDVVTYTTGDITTTSTSLVDLTGATITLVLPTASRVAFNFSGSWSLSGGNTRHINVDVDGVLLFGTNGLRYQTVTADRKRPITVGGLTAELAAGSHTIKVQWKVDGSTGTMHGSSAENYVFSAWTI